MEDLYERNKQIYNLKVIEGRPVKELMNLFKLSRSSIYRICKLLRDQNLKNPPTLSMSLCTFRHYTKETDGPVFPHIVKDMSNVPELERVARERIWEVCYEKYRQGKDGYFIEIKKEFSSGFKFDPRLHIDLYVTGLTVALIAVVNVCLRERIGLTLWHYDREKDDYFPQPIYR